MNELTRRKREQMEREETIIAAAETLLCKNGFEKTSMDDLAKASEYTKRTIYRYFTCKEDLYFAVILRGHNRLLDLIKERTQSGHTGFEKIRLAYFAYYEFLCQNPELLKLMNLSGIIKSSSTDIDMPFKKKFMDFDRQLFDGLIQMFLGGKADGSIRSDLEISQLAFSSIFTATGFFQLLALSGDTYTSHFNLNKESFVKFTIEMLLDSLKNK